MITWFKQLNEILRGDATRPSAMKDGRIETPIGGLSVVTVLLGAAYGVCIGGYAMIHAGDEAHAAYMQMIASAVKIPLLFFLTLAVTLPSLYVFNALVGSRLSVISVIRLLVAMLSVMLAVLASLGPIVLFFSFSTESYPFMILLNVVVAALAGFLGLGFLLRTLHRLILSQIVMDKTEFGARDEAKADEDPSEYAESDDADKALEEFDYETTDKARMVFRVWVVVFSLVGAQMSWVLRPFVGAPDRSFAWFRDRDSNFFLSVLESFAKLFGG